MSRMVAMGVCVLGLLSYSPDAQAEIFHTARTLKARAFSIGFEPQVYLLSPPQSVLNLHAGAGIAEGLDLEIKFGLPLPGSGQPYQLGGDLEFQLLPDTDASPAISVSVGAHAENWNAFELDGTIMISKVIRRVEPYLALDMDVTLPPYPVVPFVRLVGGLNVHLARVTELILELGIGLPGNSSYLSAGLNFYI